MTSSHEFLKSQLQQWDSWIQGGESSKVKKLCLQLNAKTIPRDLLLNYGEIARRVGAPELIIRWLRPIVRADKAPLRQQPSAQEKALYALGLFRLGAFHEAGQILKDIEGEQNPQAYFYRASLFINQWNYKKAVPELKKYVNHPGISSYQKLVGKLNLCQSLVVIQKFKRAEIEISRLMKKLEEGNFSLLKGNLLEIRSQFFFAQDQFENALRDLETATTLLHRADEHSLLYVDKWKLAIRMKTGLPHSIIIKNFTALRKRALQIKAWEILRDCDFFLALHLKDEKRLLRVYWGSLFPAYKERALSAFGNDLVVAKEYLWTESETKTASAVKASAIDLVQKAPTPVLKRFFFMMTREFYRPLRATELIDSIYPQEFYNPITSPAKLNRVIVRARKWLKEMNYPIKIIGSGNALKLQLEKSCFLLIKKDFSDESPHLLPNIFKNKISFSSKDWARELKVSFRTARRQIQQLEEAGKIEGLRRGPKTLYKSK